MLSCPQFRTQLSSGLVCTDSEKDSAYRGEPNRALDERSGGKAVGNIKDPTPRGAGQKCIEWTGAGGNYFLAVVVERGKVIAEQWGTRDEVLRWMDTEWPRVHRKFVPMVYSPVRRVRGGKGNVPMAEAAPVPTPAPIKVKRHWAG